MDCPECGKRLHRSRSRNFKESVIKMATSYKTYRCGDCGWRGMAAPAKGSPREGRLRAVLFWIAGLVIAIIIGVYAVYDLQSTTLR